MMNSEIIKAGREAAIHRPASIIIMMSLLMIVSCEPTSVESVRENIFDPKNDAFIPAAPTNIRAGSEGTEVRVSWTRNTDHAEGYLIEKSINSTSDYREIARVGPDEDRYFDQSGQFGVPTLYRVRSFVTRGGVPESHPTNPAGLLTRVTFVTLPHQIADDGSAIELHWRHFFKLHHGNLIEVKINDAEEWELHDNYRHTIAGDDFYSYMYPLGGTEETIQFRVSPYFDKDDGVAIIGGYIFPVVELP